MLLYIVKRILYIIPTIVLITIVGYFIMELPPGDYVSSWVAREEANGNINAAEEGEILRLRYGLDKPLPLRFATWLSGFVRGDFGDSLTYRQPVRSLVGERIMLTMTLSITSLFIIYLIAIPLGIYSATHQYKLGDYILTSIAFIGLGLPGFLLALVFLVVGWKLTGEVPTGLFSDRYQTAPWSLGKVIDLMRHMIIPAAIVAISGTGGLMRVMRGNLLDQLGMKYVQAARAKGLPERLIIYRHAVRNALHPIVMGLGMSFPYIVSGAAIVGVILNLPTVGPLFLQATRTQDVYLAGSLLILTAILLVIGNLVADILLAILDPRIRFD